MCKYILIQLKIWLKCIISQKNVQHSQRPLKATRTIKYLFPAEKKERKKADEMVIKPSSLRELQDWMVLHVSSTKCSRISYFSSCLLDQNTKTGALITRSFYEDSTIFIPKSDNNNVSSFSIDADISNKILNLIVY